MNLLINEPPLQVLPTLAAEIGLNNAIVLQQMHYWLRVSNNERDGYRWIYRTIDEWLPEFPFWSKRTIERIIKDLEEQKIVVAGNYNKMKMDRTKWYRIDYKTLKKLHDNAFRQNDVMQSDNLTETNAPNCQNGNRQDGRNVPAKMTVPITREYTETTTENTQKGKSRKQVYDESSVHFQLANLLYEKIVLDDSSFKKPNMNVWSDHIRLMMERDGRTEEQIKYLIEWSQSNPFWKSNILSTKKLREKATTLIRQIQAEKAKKQTSNQYARGRTEHVPDWLLKRNEQQQPLDPDHNNIDYEAERKKVLEKLGRA